MATDGKMVRVLHQPGGSERGSAARTRAKVAGAAAGRSAAPLVMIHSNAPWVPSGYGLQCATLARMLRRMGYRVVISAFYGLQGAATTWEGITVLPLGRADYGVDVLPAHAKSMEADLVILLQDLWVMPEGPIVGTMLHKIPVAAWMPVDTERWLGIKDHNVLEGTRVRPIAMSQHGLKLIREAGFSRALYVPHAVDTVDEFYPIDTQERAQVRRALGVDKDTFFIGCNAANKDSWGRKGWWELMDAFRIFHTKHPDSMLVIHTEAKGGQQLGRMRERLGLRDVIKFTDQYRILSGLDTQDDLRRWYGMLDLYAGPSLAEGFGIPLAEAQACGIPVVATKGSAMTEVVGQGGWLVEGQERWSDGHQAPWVIPNVKDLARTFGIAARRGKEYTVRKQAGRPGVEERYGLKAVEGHWVDALQAMGV